jgi:arsenate reductase
VTKAAAQRETDAGRRYEVLFLCTGNSARSQIAECLLRDLGAGRFRVHSAGSHPTGYVHPMALELLAERGHATASLRSKSWDEFAAPGAPALDFVFTVCDQAAGEVCPLWPGQPLTAHWGVLDPAAVTDASRRRWAFRRVYLELERRILLFTSLRVEALDRLTLQREIDAIGKGGPGA